MRIVLAGTCLLCLTLAVLAVPTPVPERPPAKPTGAPVSLGEAHTYSRIVKQAIDRIAKEYVRPVAEERLAAVALKALAETVEAPLPPYLLPDVEKALQSRDIDNELVRVRQHVGNSPAIQGENAIRISIQGMMKILDPPYSSYLGPDEIARDGFLSGESVGVGIGFEERTGPGGLVVRSVTLGSPAQLAGLLPDDRIEEIDGQSIGKLTAGEASRRLAKAEGTRVTLTYTRPGSTAAKRAEMLATRVKIPLIAGVRRLDSTTWDYLLDREKKIGLVRVGPLTHRQYDGSDEPMDTRDLLGKALEQLNEQGAQGIILDLRECPGGSLVGAVNVANTFVSQGVIAKVKSRGDDDPRIYNGTRSAACTDWPLVVLIGPDTSGGGELVAAALQDAERGRLAGQRTRGKASVQNQPENVGGAHYIRLSSGFFIRPSGRNLHRFADSKPEDDWGVRPDEDLEVRTSPALRRQLRSWRLQQDVRAPDSRAILPLDDPEKDPVVYAAWQDLSKRMK
jgi:carboxyl-terminal processing protease